MNLDLENISIYIRPGATDMRKQANGLSVIVSELMKEDPGSGNLYLFCNREKKLLKGLLWDRNGFWLSQKRLESGLWPWPSTGKDARNINREQLIMLLSGIDFWKAHQEMKYETMN